MSDEILRMIESVDVSDTAKLDEIDARVWCAINGLSFCGMHESWTIYCYIDPARTPEFIRGPLPTYTRSRDALKSIRPEGFRGQIILWDTGKATFKGFIGRSYEINVILAETEELAELHAIIQAIQHERSQGG